TVPMKRTICMFRSGIRDMMAGRWRLGQHQDLTAETRRRHVFFRDRTLLPNLFEPDVHDWILLPVFVVEMPPFLRIHGEAFLLHGLAQNRAALAFLGGAPGIVGESAVAHFVVSAGHLHSG